MPSNIGVPPVENEISEGLKPASFLALGGTAKAVPYPKPFMK
jgi:hypothetical protein